MSDYSQVIIFVIIIASCSNSSCGHGYAQLALGDDTCNFHICETKLSISILRAIIGEGRAIIGGGEGRHWGGGCWTWLILTLSVCCWILTSKIAAY